ncbi:MAG TPA: hypothetical protein PLK55_00040 [archaeon]|jgi:hypothetical protein|nr:hypothetical protein [archaeon]
MALKFWNLQNANNGQIFVIDGIFALIFASLLIVMAQTLNSSSLTENNIELLKMQKINDLLITSQYLKIDNLEALENNYLLLFPITSGYIIINNNRKEINSFKTEKTKILSNSIKYINNSNNKIYIEVGVYS